MSGVLGEVGRLPHRAVARTSHAQPLPAETGTRRGTPRGQYATGVSGETLLSRHVEPFARHRCDIRRHRLDLAAGACREVGGAQKRPQVSSETPSMPKRVDCSRMRSMSSCVWVRVSDTLTGSRQAF